MIQNKRAPDKIQKGQTSILGFGGEFVQIRISDMFYADEQETYCKALCP